MNVTRFRFIRLFHLLIFFAFVGLSSVWLSAVSAQEMGERAWWGVNTFTGETTQFPDTSEWARPYSVSFYHAGSIRRHG